MYGTSFVLIRSGTSNFYPYFFYYEELRNRDTSPALKIYNSTQNKYFLMRSKVIQEGQFFKFECFIIFFWGGGTPLTFFGVRNPNFGLFFKFNGLHHFQKKIMIMPYQHQIPLFKVVPPLQTCFLKYCIDINFFVVFLKVLVQKREQIKKNPKIAKSRACEVFRVRPRAICV